MSKKQTPRPKASKPPKAKIVKDTSSKVHQRDKISFKLNIKERDDLTDRQKEFIALATHKDTRVIFVQGPAGTSKSFMAVLCGLKLLNERRVSDILYVRSVAESASKSLGYLPGTSEDKLEPFLMPLHDKLEELLDSGDIMQLLKEERVEGKPVNYLRGASPNAKYVIADESQNFTFGELTTIITRIGEFTRIIVLGDPNQSDIGRASGFKAMCEAFDTERHRAQGIFNFVLTKDDIVRSGILKLIVETIEEYHAEARKQNERTEHMFPRD